MENDINCIAFLGEWRKQSLKTFLVFCFKWRTRLRKIQINPIHKCPSADLPPHQRWLTPTNLDGPPWHFSVHCLQSREFCFLLLLVLSRIPSHVPTLPSHRKSVQLNMEWGKWFRNCFLTSNLFRGTHPPGWGRVLINVEGQLLAAKSGDCCTAPSEFNVSRWKSRITRSFKWLREIFHDAFPAFYCLQACLFLGFG